MVHRGQRFGIFFDTPGAERSAPARRVRSPPAAGWTGRPGLLTLACAGLIAGGCSALPPAPAPQPVSPLPPDPIESPAAIPVLPSEPECRPCAELRQEIAVLRRELAGAESRLEQAREKNLEQAKALEAAERRTAMTRARLRRFATPAAAASYLAEVEVELTAARSAAGSEREAALLERARAALDASWDPFVRGEYGAAIERAAEAAELVAHAVRPPQGDGGAARKVVHFREARPLRARVDSHLRQGPGSGSPVVGVVPAGAPVRAHAARGQWYRLETADGRWGWTYRPLLAPR